MLSKAIEIASKAHGGQIDKGGQPYILHPLRVMMNCASEIEKICAVLHDVVEDTEITFDDLQREGFGADVLEVLDCLTHKDNESYDGYIDRVLQNQTACRVKLSDLADNMDLTRIPTPTEQDRERIKKYTKATERINEALPYVDEIPNSRLIQINGVAEIHSNISHDQFLHMFLRFIESQGWFFGGGTEDVTDKTERDYDIEETAVKTILSRYTCRDYEAEMPPNEKLHLIAQAAVAAPSGMNRQPWRVLVVKNPALIAELEAEGLKNLAALEDKSAYERIMSRGGKLFYHAPCLVIIPIENTESSGGALADCGIVAENIALSATALGIDSCICGLAGFCFSGENGAAFKQRLNFPDGYDFGLAVLLGYAKTPGKPHEPDMTKISFVE